MKEKKEPTKITQSNDYYYYREKVRRELKLRKLAITDDTSEEPASQCHATFIKVLLSATTIISVIVAIYAYSTQNHLQLLPIYRKQLDYYMNGANKDSWHCRQPFDPNAILRPLTRQVAAQSAALAAIDTLLWRHHVAQVTGIVLAGGSGVGKSLTVSLIRNHWQWPLNVQSVSVDRATDTDISDRAYRLLNDCGHNLIVVDNMQLAAEVAKLHWSLLLRLTGGQTVYNVIVVYVLNVPSYSFEDVLLLEGKIDQLTALSELDSLTMVPFAGIDTIGLRQCIRLECERTGVLQSLDAMRMERIVESIDVQRSGCKHVHTKVALHM